MESAKVLTWFKKQEDKHREAWFVLIFTKPSLYLFALMKSTILMGLFLFFVYEFFIKYLGIKDQAIPSTLHSLVGIVIGLLLVFRTNTAYDRWWEARKIFASLQSAVIYIRIKFIDSSEKDSVIEHLNAINTNLFKFMSTKEGEESVKLKDDFIASYATLSKIITKEKFVSPIFGSVEKKLVDILEYFSALERIKDTPIPASYSFHIKISVFAYLLTLPFGLFFGMGLWSIPLVMILYFIIAGIEIISNEIENPFREDPNDLPIENYKKENEKYINGNG
jgi:ion channel-forming bestrophin family protein